MSLGTLGEEQVTRSIVSGAHSKRREEELGAVECFHARVVGRRLAGATEKFGRFVQNVRAMARRFHPFIEERLSEGDVSVHRNRRAVGLKAVNLLATFLASVEASS